MVSSPANVDILSFDGGGSRGIMELSILDDVMRLATIVLQTPEKVEKYSINENALDNLEKRKQLIGDLKSVTKPLHPTEVYEMIVGTSTGALIAFGLVGGNENEHGERIEMSVEDCIEMYQKNTEAIFKISWWPPWHWFLSKTSSIPLTTYPQSNVKTALFKQFGDSSLHDFKSKCVAGAVARKIGNNEELVLFDTKSKCYQFYKAYQVLLATSNAPVYFHTPVRIGNDEFVDGGVGGNCPLVQAIPRVRELFSDDDSADSEVKITSALSIAPPSPIKVGVPDHFQIKYWLNYFVDQSTGGYAVYKDAVERNKRKKTLFRRLSPRGEALKVFKLDEVDAQKMLDAMESERLNNEMFLIDIIAIAMVVVYTSLDKVNKNAADTTIKVAAELAETAAKVYFSKQEYALAIDSYHTSIRLWKKATNKEHSRKLTLSRNYHQMAKCLQEEGKYQKAINLYRSNLKWLLEDGSNEELVVESYLEIAECLLLMFRYKEAEDVYEKVHKICEEGKFPAVYAVRILRGNAWSVQHQGMLDKAAHKYMEAVKRLPEKDSHEKAETLNDLGMCFLELRLLNKAQKNTEDAIEMRKRLSNDKENDLHIAESLNNLGLCYIKNGDHDAALRAFTKSLDMYNKSDDDADISIAIISENLARCLLLKKGADHSRAMALVQQALDAKMKSLGGLDNPGIAKSLTAVGLCSLATQRFDEATENLLKAERMTIRLFGGGHPSLAEIYHHLSDLYFNDKMSKWEKKKGEEYKNKEANIDNIIKEMSENI